MAKCNENAIREAAYYIWQKAGMPLGKDEEFWWMAVEQVNGCKSSGCCDSNAKSAPKKAAAKSATVKKAAPKKAAAK